MIDWNRLKYDQNEALSLFLYTFETSGENDPTGVNISIKSIQTDGSEQTV